MKVVAYLVTTFDVPDSQPRLMFPEEIKGHFGLSFKPLVELTPALKELVEAAINLENVKGRHHSQIAMERLSKAAKAFNEAGK